ncbi:MAG: CinA family protein [Campylobacteraceae bacterium]|nr:CinA family protein [Campylobacteraceae bacterium]
MYESIFSNEDMIKLQNILKKQNKTITCAESCTGGLVSYLITQVSGSSEIFNGSIVSYSNEVKNNELNVEKLILKNHGAVSFEVVKQMLSGVREKFAANYAIAISGIAGPNGGSKEKPVGTVIIGIHVDADQYLIEEYHFKGTRNEVQIQAAKSSLKKLLNFLTKSIDK